MVRSGTTKTPALIGAGVGGRVLARTAFGLAAFALFGELWLTVITRVPNVSFGRDLMLYLGATERWLSGGPFYLPEQVAGPFTVEMGAVLYPPSAMYLFAPFLVLPIILWWAIPFAIVSAVVWRHRPSILGWAGILACIALPYSIPLIAAGNPLMWTTAALALGTIYGWPSVLVLVKPILAPFALVGIRRPSWWVALAACALLSVPFLPMWPDYVRVLLNAHHTETVDYILQNVPMMLIPLVAYYSRSKVSQSTVSATIAS